MTTTPPPLPRITGVREMRWASVGLSLMIPGLGIILAGRRLEGWAWFLAMTALVLLSPWTFSVRILPGFLLGLLTCMASVVIWALMLRRSYFSVSHLKPKHWARIAAAAVFFVLSLSLAVRELVRPFALPTGGMSPTLQGTKNPIDGSEKTADRILVQGCAYWFQKPQRGDILVFRTKGIQAMQPSQREQIYIKRIVGLPGDRISFQDGKLMNNGMAVEKPVVFARLKYVTPPYVPSPYLQREGEVFEVPAGGYFVVGDNSTNSYDSRHWGPVPAENVIGRATKIYWPPQRAGSIE